MSYSFFATRKGTKHRCHTACSPCLSSEQALVKGTTFKQNSLWPFGKQLKLKRRRWVGIVLTLNDCSYHHKTWSPCDVLAGCRKWVNHCSQKKFWVLQNPKGRKLMKESLAWAMRRELHLAPQTFPL